VDELLVTTRLAITAQPGIEAFGLVPIDGDGPGWRAIAVVRRRDDDDAEVLALIAVDHENRRRLLDGVTDELRADGCAQLWVDGDATAL
jgi:hypothetical protein